MKLSTFQVNKKQSMLCVETFLSQLKYLGIGTYLIKVHIEVI